MSLPTANAPPGRHIGVIKANSQVAPENEKVYGKKNTLVGCLEMRTFVLLYHDGSGLRSKPHVVHEFGGKFYTAPNAIDWGEGLRELEPWLQEAAAKQVARFDANSPAPPDGVDVVQEVP